MAWKHWSVKSEARVVVKCGLKLTSTNGAEAGHLAVGIVAHVALELVARRAPMHLR